MEVTLSLESRDIAEELRLLIKQLESAKWRDEIAHIHERLSQLSARIQVALKTFEVPEGDAILVSLRERLHTLEAYIGERLPDLDQTKAQFKQEWQAYKQKLILSYEALAANLQLQDIHVPSLRPTNYWRNLFHVGWSLAVLALIQLLLPWSTLRWVALGFLTWAWSMELFRRSSPRLNGLLMKGLGAFAHPHEHYRVNSGTWYISALFVLSLTTTPLIATIAVIVLGFADPAAAIIGRRWGRLKIYAGRTLEGSLAFVVAGTLAGRPVRHHQDGLVADAPARLRQRHPRRHRRAV